LLLLLGCYEIQFFSQTVSEALKFDEFSIEPRTSTFEHPRFKRFAAQLKKEPKKSGIIIRYEPRKQTYGNYRSVDDYLSDAKREIENEGIAEARIKTIHGGIREEETFEFWIAPGNSEMPLPKSHFEKSDVIFCPSMGVSGTQHQTYRDQPLKFSVAVHNAPPDVNIGYEWAVSTGSIVEGNGTNQIKVDLSKTDAKRVTASVNIKGFAPECANHAFATAQVGVFPYQFESTQFYEYSYAIALLDGLFVLMQSEPHSRGHIIIYGRRTGNGAEVPRIIRSVNNHIIFRGQDPSRLTIINGGFRETSSVEMYLLPAGVFPPAPTPTVDERYVTFTNKKKSPRKRRNN
jgi:hypothetical protein